jgi:hypothetical protein
MDKSLKLAEIDTQLSNTASETSLPELYLLTKVPSFNNIALYAMDAKGIRKIVAFSGILPQYLRCTSHSLVTIMTELLRLIVFILLRVGH